MRALPRRPAPAFLFSLALAALPAVAEEPPFRIGSRLEPLVDAALVDRMKDVSLRLHPPVPREAVFRFDAPWEGPDSGYATVLQDGDRFRLYYRGSGAAGREVTCVAESGDGVRWTRPELGLFEFRGSKQNNIVWTGERKGYCESHNFAPFVDANPAAKPDERYKAVTLGKWPKEDVPERGRALFAFVSPDGIRWRRLRDEPVITEGGGFDSHNTAFWDSVLRTYVCYSRVGREGKRSVQRSTSANFAAWSKPDLLDFGRAPIEQFYTNGIFAYFRAPHVRLGFPMRFVPERKSVGDPPRTTDGLSDAVFMSSRDGLRWERPFLEAWIRPGPEPANWGHAHGNQTPVWGILPAGPDEISVYWLERYGTEGGPVLRRGTVRMDGFVSANAPYGGGELVTKPLVFEGKALLLNVATSAVGGVRVEIQDEAGRIVPGFKLSAAKEIWGDDLSRVVAWESGSDVGALAGKPVRLRFVMRDADLYAFRFRP